MSFVRLIESCIFIFLAFQGSKCEVQVKNGGIYEGVFKTYSPKVILFILTLPYFRILGNV